MEGYGLEGMVTELEADAKAIMTLVLDVTDHPSDEDPNRLHAVLKLAEDQIRLTKDISERLAAG